ncbi:hypothetical protein [Spelaeicoccus albus]|uniref:Uncharacterized protein n=1 Tax=Spelaeicoccus albus TaxID=1280376 RepID=A0A7Z0ACA8_9MICO|nr:hypothetical protein [Spelaeicoccus albus]NYI67295.1 hypothetical protein [Spelaeicoccus albus]
MGHVERGPRYVDTSEPTVKPAAATHSSDAQSGRGGRYRAPAVAGTAIGLLFLIAIIAVGVPILRGRGRRS